MGNDPLNAVDPHGLLLEDAGNTASGLASDFYQQSILKPISDIQGYANDLLTNPAYFFQNASGALASVAPEFQSISTLFGSVGSGIAAESGFGVAGRVAELQDAIPLAQQGGITMAVGLAEDANGMQQVLIGTSEPMGYLRPGVTLNPGEILAPGLGHAEADIINFAQQNGFNLLEVGATRPICASCASLIEGAGATPVTPLKVP